MSAAFDPRLLARVAAQPYPLVFATISGAHLYGFPSPDSDYDLRGVHVLPLREVVGLEPPLETIEVSADDDGLEIDLVTHDLKKFIALMLKPNGYVLEQLYSPLVVHTTPVHDELKALGRGCITREHSRHYLGFAESRWRLLEKEQPWRVKPLLYLYRVLLTGIHLMRTGEVEANLVDLNAEYRLPYIDDLIARKRAGAERATVDDADHAFHAAEYARLEAELAAACAASALPAEPAGREELNELLIKVRLS